MDCAVFLVVCNLPTIRTMAKVERGQQESVSVDDTTAGSFCSGVRIDVARGVCV